MLHLPTSTYVIIKGSMDVSPDSMYGKQFALGFKFIEHPRFLGSSDILVRDCCNTLSEKKSVATALRYLNEGADVDGWLCHRGWR